MFVKVSGIKSGVYTLHSFHHGARAQTGFDIYLTDYNGSWTKRLVASNFQGSFGSTVDNSAFVTDIVVTDNNITNSFELEFKKLNSMGY